MSPHPAPRANAVDAPIALLGDVAQSDLARGDDAVVGFARYAARIEHGGNALSRHGRVGDEDHRAAAGAKLEQRIARRTEGAVAIVQHSPHIAEHDVVARQQLGGVRQYGRMRQVAGHRRARSAKEERSGNELEGVSIRSVTSDAKEIGKETVMADPQGTPEKPARPRDAR